MKTICPHCGGNDFWYNPNGQTSAAGGWSCLKCGKIAYPIVSVPDFTPAPTVKKMLTVQLKKDSKHIEFEGVKMTSGYMKCPKCRRDFVKEADYVNGVWTNFPEPWTCSYCGASVVVDKEKGYGLVATVDTIKEIKGTMKEGE